VLRSALAQRVSFAESAGKGLTVLETEPKGLAAKEVVTMVDELLELI
jgi:chromosome partitioning protein